MATQMQIDWYKASESERHNRATERQAANELAENRRHNLKGEYLQDASVRIEGGKLSESIRHNYQTERLQQLGETTKLLTMQEAARHNRVGEQLETRKIDVSEAYNKMSIGLGYDQLSEAQRHNVATEGITYIQAQAAKEQAAASTSQAKTAQRRQTYDALGTLSAAYTNAYNAQTNRKAQEVSERQGDRSLDLKAYDTGANLVYGAVDAVSKIIPRY